MPGKTRGKIRYPKELVYDTLETMSFVPVIQTTAGAIVNTTVLAVLPLASAFKVAKVAVSVYGTVAGTAAINIVVGSNPENGAGIADTYDTGVLTVAPSQTTVFNVDQALTMTSGSTQIYTPTVPEVIYPSGMSLTLRMTASSAFTGSIQVSLYGKFTDVNPTDPQASTNAGGAPHSYTLGVDPL
ncbi:MAG: hypothetical protein ACREQ5_09665 [Candidatus Dormibacteria bacterium]